MKICKCQFCGTITKVDWMQGPLPGCPNCQGVFDLEDIYDEEDEDFDNKETPVETYTTTNGRVIKNYYNKNVNNVVDDSSTDTEPNEDDDEFDEDTQSMHKTIINWVRDYATNLVALALLIGSFVCFGWVLFDFFSKADQSNHKKSSLASEKTYATQDAMPNNNSAGGAEVRLVDNIIIENGEEGVNYEITARLVDVDTERSETEENETESQDTSDY